MKLKLSPAQILIVGIALVFIAYGILSALFKFSLNQNALNIISFVLVAAALGLFLSERKKRILAETGTSPGMAELLPNRGISAWRDFL